MNTLTLKLIITQALSTRSTHQHSTFSTGLNDLWSAQTQAPCEQQRGALSYRVPCSSIISVSLGVSEVSSFTSSSSLVSLKETNCSLHPSTHTVFCSLCLLFRFLLYSWYAGGEETKIENISLAKTFMVTLYICRYFRALLFSGSYMYKDAGKGKEKERKKSTGYNKVALFRRGHLWLRLHVLWMAYSW